eukprot:CAMPEP_0170074526 /NCGR_PEP_ID=MMETSP0019_2-20121128/11815_1 /TAXON_ID=98059 /ORGANISM="Dinobryon sp., Strain UTEXLB2267" /LENGTH=67 /DNA_ID=CAMNT_0010284887 /DNA_START=1143 /DNA_END=1342 /DNA_ORIENTATION=+
MAIMMKKKKKKELFVRFVVWNFEMKKNGNIIWIMDLNQSNLKIVFNVINVLVLLVIIEHFDNILIFV